MTLFNSGFFVKIDSLTPTRGAGGNVGLAEVAMVGGWEYITFRYNIVLGAK